MWQFSVPIPNWTGFCLGVIVTNVLLFAIALVTYWRKRNNGD